MSTFETMPTMLAEAQLTDFGEFYYDANNQDFFIAGEVVAMADKDVYNCLLSPMPEKSAEISREVGAFITSFGTIITTPLVHKWLRLNGEETNFNDVNNVLRYVFEEKLDKQDDDTSVGGQLYGFSSHFVREGQVRLSVTGDCACCGPNLFGTFVEEHEWETGFAEYELHNIDFPAQHVALLAGLGHLALTAKNAQL
ncbi:MAG: hypothetical protein U5L95_03815 [Candidatus Saccharibacteria bacterium]|nr:hypothetical protein [Candidatus Saccharibacteria bacterium]